MCGPDHYETVCPRSLRSKEPGDLKIFRVCDKSCKLRNQGELTSVNSAAYQDSMSAPRAPSDRVTHEA